jgi:CheY-like chemotaxis protein
MDTLATGGAATVDKYRKQQIDEWLNHADRFLRAGRYVVADEYLQKVRRLQPSNSTAANYQDRIHFLVRQLSQRVGLDRAIQMEVRRFIELLESRKTNQVNSYLLNAKKLLEEGGIQLARENCLKALALDAGNTYGKAMLQQLDEMRKNAPDAAEQQEELHFRDFLTELWKQGKPGTEHDGLIASMQVNLQISNSRRMELLRGVKNHLYKEALQEIWLTGGLSAFDMDTVERLRSRYDVSWLDHSLIETTMLKEVRKNKVRANILIVDSDDASLLQISQLLRSGSFAVIAAGSVKEALEAIETVTPDLILSELAFTDGSLGFDLYGFARESKRTEKTPFLFMTPSLDRTTHIIGKKVGVDDFIAKPVDGELLLATITGLLMHKNGNSRSEALKNGAYHFFRK